LGKRIELQRRWYWLRQAYVAAAYRWLVLSLPGSPKTFRVSDVPARISLQYPGPSFLCGGQENGIR
jgi:hypothetical protein